MKIVNFLEVFFVISGGMAMPFIVISSYFNFIPRNERTKPLAIFFLVISVIYAAVYSYFSWKILKNSLSKKGLE